jgi:hypothetical protein
MNKNDRGPYEFKKIDGLWHRRPWGSTPWSALDVRHGIIAPTNPKRGHRVRAARRVSVWTFK